MRWGAASRKNVTFSGSYLQKSSRIIKGLFKRNYSDEFNWKETKRLSVKFGRKTRNFNLAAHYASKSDDLTTK